jgi:hypothetical protein
MTYQFAVLADPMRRQVFERLAKRFFVLELDRRKVNGRALNRVLPQQPGEIIEQQLLKKYFCRIPRILPPSEKT